MTDQMVGWRTNERIAQLWDEADRRRLAAPVAAPASFWEVAHAWYRQGFLHPGGEP